jgi:hypothetical protein
MARNKTNGWQRHLEMLQADPDLTRALRCLRRGLGHDQVIVLTVTPHDDPAQLDRLHRVYETMSLFEEDS